ncbi:hypothetical protein ES708_23023 [subsurface metagenome]
MMPVTIDKENRTSALKSQSDNSSFGAIASIHTPARWQPVFLSLFSKLYYLALNAGLDCGLTPCNQNLTALTKNTTSSSSNPYTRASFYN